MRDGAVTATCVDGRVYGKWDDEDHSERVDLLRIPNEFLASAPDDSVVTAIQD